jgi:hypothetical protein
MSYRNYRKAICTYLSSRTSLQHKFLRGHTDTQTAKVISGTSLNFLQNNGKKLKRLRYGIVTPVCLCVCVCVCVCACLCACVCACPCMAHLFFSIRPYSPFVGPRPLFQFINLIRSPFRSRKLRNGRRDPSREPRDTLYPQKSVLTSPTRGGRSVGRVRSRTKAGKFSYYSYLIHNRMNAHKHPCLQWDSISRSQY